MEEAVKTDPYERAKKRVEQLGKFYKHLRVYIVVNLALLIIKLNLYEVFTDNGITDSGFYNWWEWNIIGTPLLWGLGLSVHAFYVFVLKGDKFFDLKPNFVKKWEARQLEKFIREEE